MGRCAVIGAATWPWRLAILGLSQVGEGGHCPTAWRDCKTLLGFCRLREEGSAAS